MIQLSEGKTEKMIQTLTLEAAYPAFDKTIREGCLVGCSNGAAIWAAEELIESLGELAVTIMDQEPHVDALILGPQVNMDANEPGFRSPKS